MLSKVAMVLVALCQENKMTETGDGKKAMPDKDPGGCGSMAMKGQKGTEDRGFVRRMYGREFLFKCSRSTLCHEMPRELSDKLREFPVIKRKPMESVRFFGFPHQPSVLDSLPLRPTAQIFTWDPLVKQWVPRARPQES